MSKLTDNLVNNFRERFIRPAVEKETAGLKKQLQKSKAQLEEKGWQDIGSIGGKWSGGSSTNQQLLRVYYSWAYANITVIAARVADITLEMYQVKNKEVRELEEHPLIELLSRVNDYQTKWDLIYTWSISMLTYGEAAWYLVGSKNENSQPTEIWPLKCEYLKPIPGDMSNNEFIKHWEYRLPGRKLETFQPYELLFFKEPHPTSPYRGYGTLEAAAQDVLIDYHATNYNQNFFENFARPDGVLHTEAKLTDSVYERLVEKWDQKFRGSNNAGKTAILEQGLDYKPISQSSKDMDFVEQQKWIRDKIMAMFKNTKVILGIVEDVNRANAEASEAIWIKHNIKPKMQRLVGYINEFLVPRYGDDIFLGFEDPLPENVELRLTEYEKGHGKWLTVNEIREDLGREPVEGGDKLYVPITNIPIDQEPFELPATEEPAPKGFIALTAKGGVKRNRQDQLKKRYSNEIRTLKLRQYRFKRDLDYVQSALQKQIIVSLKTKGVKEDGHFNDEAKQLMWEIMVKLAGVFENQIVRIVEAVIKKHKEETLKLLEKYKPSKSFKKKGASDFLPSDEKYVRVSINALTPIIRRLIEEQGGRALDSLGVDTQFVINEAIRKSIRKFVGKASDTYVSTLRESIGNTIQLGLQEGWGVEKMGREIRSQYGSISRPTGLRLARTESIRASNFAQEEAYKASKIVEGKQWFTAIDERVCPYCEALDGKIYELNETILETGSEFLGNADTPLSIDYNAIEYPPLHPNCRCTLVPVLSRKGIKPLNKVLKNRPEKKAVSKQPNFDHLLAAKVKEQVETAKAGMREEFETKLAEMVEKEIKTITEEINATLRDE